MASGSQEGDDRIGAGSMSVRSSRKRTREDMGRECVGRTGSQGRPQDPEASYRGVMGERGRIVSAHSETEVNRDNLPLWDRRNPGQMTAMSEQKEFLERIRRNMSYLTGALKPSLLWPILLETETVDENTIQEIELNATDQVQTRRLLAHIGRGPTAWFHAFLQACALTNQSHIISKLGLPPGDYEEAGGIQEMMDLETIGSGENTYQLSERLQRAIKRHCEGCKRNLMMRKVLDFKEDDRGDIINTAKCYIQLQVQIQDHMLTLKIPDREIFEKLQVKDHLRGKTYEQDAPQCIRLFGPPGAGKTTFGRHVVHAWSIDFLEKGPGKWTTMVYIPAREITSTITEAIKDHLWCEEEDVDILLAHVNKGDGVAIVLDAVDEIRKEEVLADLQRYIHQRQTRGGPKLLVSARSDLCMIDPQDFNRFLKLEGFTVEQGLEYMKQYFSLGHPQQIHRTVLNYVNQHKNKMEAVICNPLKLHIFCALAEKGLLELGEEFKLEILNVFEPLEKYLTTREGGKVTVEDSRNFYKLCLYALLSGKREFPEDLLKEFKIVKNYLAFLVSRDVRDKDANMVTFFSFTHEMVFEYFASRHIENMSLGSLQTLLLSICSKRTLRNTQKLMFEIITKKQFDTEDLSIMMIRMILILQQHVITEGKSDVLDRLLSLSTKISSPVEMSQLILTQQDDEQVRHTEAILDVINDAFVSHNDVLKEVGWFHSLEAEGTIKHVVDCLQVCKPEQLAKITRDTLHFLMPCSCKSHFGFTATVNPVARTRWGYLFKYLEGKDIISAWTVEDMREVVKAYTTLNKDHKAKEVHLHIAAEGVLLGGPRTVYVELWGEPPADSWSEEAWTNLSEDLPATWGSDSVDIFLSPKVPLEGLLACLPQIHMQKEKHIKVNSGTVGLAKLEACVIKCQQIGRQLTLNNTRIMVLDVQSEGSVIARKDWLCQAKGRSGDLILTNPIWHTVTAENMDTSEGDLREPQQRPAGTEFSAI